jgi:hypothetical protein
VFVAVFEERKVLMISISDSADISPNDFDLFIDSVKQTDGKMEEIELPYGTRVKIVPKAAKYYIYNGYSGTISGTVYDNTDIIEFDLQGATSLTLEFVSEVFTLNLTPDVASANGELIYEENLVFAIGDTIVIRFNVGTGYDLSSMKLNGVDLTGYTSGNMVYRNGTLTINVTAAWLDIWEDAIGAENTFSMSIAVTTAISTIVIIGAGAIGAVAIGAIIAIALAMVSIKRKKKDYALAKEMHKKGMQRLNQNVVSDLLKNVTETKEASE